MIINLDIPEDIEDDLEGIDKDALYRKLMEIAAVEAYRQRRIGTAGVRRMLGFENRWQTIDFLGVHKVYPNYNEEDAAEDWASIQDYKAKKAKQVK